jgi:hypothetical protein
MKKLVVALTLSASALAVQAKDIVDTAVAAGSFKTLAAALTAAGLIDTLKGKGPFTVFAPTDEAFAKVPKADLDALLKDKAKLTAVLTYHVVQRQGDGQGRQGRQGQDGAGRRTDPGHRRWRRDGAKDDIANGVIHVRHRGRQRRETGIHVIDRRRPPVLSSNFSPHRPSWRAGPSSPRSSCLLSGSPSSCSLRWWVCLVTWRR